MVNRNRSEQFVDLINNYIEVNNDIFGGYVSIGVRTLSPDANLSEVLTINVEGLNLAYIEIQFCDEDIMGFLREPTNKVLSSIIAYDLLTYDPDDDFYQNVIGQLQHDGGIWDDIGEDELLDMMYEDAEGFNGFAKELEERYA